MKPKLFIGSSSESLFVVREFEKIFSKDYQVKVWDKAFQAGDFFLETLQKELFLTDFAVFIIAPDDKTNKRGSVAFSTRDNVIFELGMFIGALGIKNAQFIVVDIIKKGRLLKLNLPSDLDGLKRVKAKVTVDDKNQLIDGRESLENAFIALKENLDNQQQSIALHLLPSTSLAIGYYHNFILQACKELYTKKKFKVSNKFYDLTKDIFDFYIIIPDKGSDASHEAYSKFVSKSKMKHIEIKSKTSSRPFPFFIKYDTKKGRVQFYDLPTTLRASRETIQLVMPPSTTKKVMEELELKEISNFSFTIEHLLNLPESAGFRDNIHLLPASKLLNAI